MTISPNNVQSTLQKHILADGMRAVFDANNSHGSYLKDAQTGKEYLDLFSFFATQPIAFNHPKINNSAFREKLGRLAMHRPTLSDIYTPEYAEFIETFSRATNRGVLKHYFFIEGGAMGVENALKVAMDWKVQKNLANGKTTGELGTQIIHFKNAFHGRSGYTVSMTNTYQSNKYKYFAKFKWPRVTSPALQFPITDQILEQTITLEKQSINEIKQALAQNKDDIAALILEPIQCEGGDNHFRKEFFEQLRVLADENEFMLIFDEVQTGIGVTGKMWCFEHFGVTPDIISFGKKVQVAGCATGARVDEVPTNVFKQSSRINSTWGGNLVDMVRCQKYLEIIEEDHLIEHTATMGKYFVENLQKISGTKPISNVRGRGLLLAFDLQTTEKRDQVLKTMHDNGAIALGCGEKSVRIRPHMDVTKTEADHALQIIEKSI